MTLTLTGIGTINFLATTASTTYSLTTGGKVMPNLTVNVGTTTTIQFADDVTATGATITLTQGGLDTNNKAVTCSTFSSNTSITRTLTLGTTTITCTTAGTAWNTGTITNFTFSAAASAIVISGATATLNSGPLAFGTVQFVGTGTAFLSVTSGSSYVNLTRTGTAAKNDGLQVLIASGTVLTVTGTLTLASNSLVNRLFINSNVPGTTRTITAATLVATGVVNFQDITGAGAATWTAGASGATAFGDCGGNSGITFADSVTRYGVVAGNWSNTATWSTTSGGGGGASVPLPQDDVILNGSSAAGTYTMDMPGICRDLTCTGFTRTLSLATSAQTFYGSVTLSTGMTLLQSQTCNFAGRGTHTITSAGKIFSSSGGTVVIGQAAALPSIYSFLDAFWTVGTFTQGGISLNTGGFAVTCLSYTHSTSAAKILTMTDTTWTLTGTGASTVWSWLGGTLNATDSTITISVASTSTRTFTGGGNTYGTLTYTVADSRGSLAITGANTFTTINVSDTTRQKTLILPSATTTTITSGFNVNGTSGIPMSLTSSTAGSAATLSVASGTVTVNYLNIKDSTATGGATFNAVNSQSISGNSGWTFSYARTLAGTRTLAGGRIPSGYLFLPGVVGNYASTPDSASLSITGDIDIRIWVALNDWTPAALGWLLSKWDFASQNSYGIYINTNGKFSFRASHDGTALAVNAMSTVAPSASAGEPLWVRVTLSGASVKFYTASGNIASPADADWAQLGATVTVTAGAIFNSTTAVIIGIAVASNPMVGKVYYAQIRDGIDGTIVASPTFDTAPSSPFTDAQGNSWTVNTSGGLPAALTKRTASGTRTFVS